MHQEEEVLETGINDVSDVLRCDRVKFEGFES
jgi:hypothetical protein